jgi:hypothetical protein
MDEIPINPNLPTQADMDKPDTPPEQKALFDKTKFDIASKLKAVLIYISSNTPELKNDLERIKMKCELFRKNKLCNKCVFFLDGSCVFWDKHYNRFSQQQEK